MTNQEVVDYVINTPNNTNPVILKQMLKDIAGSGNLELDTTLSVAGKAADAKAVGDKIAEITGISLIEPAEDDIPKIFFGGALQQTKDEAVVPFRYISKTDDFSGYAEIKAQGNSSMSYPKKNQTVKMFADEACDGKMKKDFKGWGKQNKHVYKANWIDLTHARNVVSARLWGDVVKSRSNYAELPELLRTSPNQGAVDGFPVKVYADGVYQGRYTLNIPKDAWMANMDKDLDTHCILCGENYASGCFRASANINESDWTDEIHDTVPASIKTRWNQVISFVMNSTDEEFRANLNQYFYVDSLIDYYLFGLASCGLDAFGKNQIYATYDGQRWIASMYDMDSTWGLYWNGSKFVSTSYGRNEFEDMISGRQGNLLYIRLEQLFWSELQTRWAELKNGALSIENIINRFERFTDIASAELVKEDYASTTGGGKFTGIPSQTTNNIQQIRAFALARQAWTDEYLEGLTPEVGIPCTGITLDKTELTFDGAGTQIITATVTPSDTTDTVVWVSSALAVASISVEGNVCTVQSKKNGDAVITVTCGDYSTNCTVTVGGISNTGLVWSETAEYKVDENTGEVVAGDSYVTDMFTIEKGHSYICGDFTNRPRYIQLSLYDEEGVLIWSKWSAGLFAVNLYDDSNVSTARLSIPPEAGKDVDLASAGLVKKDSWSIINGNAIRATLNKKEYSESHTDGLFDHINLTRFPVDVGKTYRLSGKDGDTTTWKRICVFDVNDTLVYSTTGANTTDAAELTMPENAAYVRCSAYGTGAVGELLEFTEVSVSGLTPTTIAMARGNSLDETNGQLVEKEHGFVSDYVDISSYKIINVTFTYKWNTICAYDAERNFITTLSKTTNNENITGVPVHNDVKYIRMSAEEWNAPSDAVCTATISEYTGLYMTNGLTIDSNGAVITGNTANFALEDYVEVNPGETYVITCKNFWLDVFGYNSEKVFVSRLNTASRTENTATVTIPDSVKYIRWAASGSDGGWTTVTKQ